MPGFAADGSPYLPAPAAAAGGQPAAPPPPPLLQAKWGYALAEREQLLVACQHPLLRLPGVLLVSKELSSSSVLSPPRLPQRLQWAGGLGPDARQLLKQGLVAAVSIPRPPGEAPTGASRPPRPSGGQRGAYTSKLHAANFVPTMPPVCGGEITGRMKFAMVVRPMALQLFLTFWSALPNFLQHRRPRARGRRRRQPSA